MITDARTAELGGIATESHPDTVAVQARNYTHPHLPGRTVVRLVRENLAEVEDLSLGVLNFPAAETARIVGYTYNQAVGFPAWPIIHDPKNARHALNLVQDLRRAARLARSRPGPAKDTIDELAATLGASAPHFLPTFLEEAARIFRAENNLTYAAQFFSKAREAERVHNLVIDEDRHRSVLLEFALSGALSAKELTNESKALLERTTPDQALALFTRLNVDRVRGGLPPYANLSADLRRLVKAAGEDQASAEEAFLAAVLGLPSLNKAPGGFWKSYLPALARLAGRDQIVRESLLQVIPEAVTGEAWVDTLEKVGIADELRAGTLDAADWATRLIRELQGRYDEPYPHKLAALLRQCPTLAGQTITLLPRKDRLFVEILDALLAAGATIAFDPAFGSWRQNLSLLPWAKEEGRGDLAHFTAQPELVSLVDDVRAVLQAGHLPVLLANPGTAAILQQWAGSRFSAEPTLYGVNKEVHRLEPLMGPEGYQAAPAGINALFALDGAELLAANLRHGLLTELTWPALEAAAARLEAANTDAAAKLPAQVTCHESWPAVGVACNGQVVFVDGDQEIAAATFSGGTDPENWSYFLVDGVIGCYLKTGWWESELAWSDDPATTIPQKYWSVRESSQSFAVPGGRLTSQGLQRAGDPKALFADRGKVLHEDGHFWAGRDKGWREQSWHELDPATGKAGRESLPPKLAALVAEQLRAGYTVSGETTWCPATPTTAGSLVSTSNGWHGQVVLAKGWDNLLVTAAGVDEGRFLGRIARPGGGHWKLDVLRGLFSGTGKPLMNALDRFGRPNVLHTVPLAGWHQFRVRDEEVSERLRAITAAEVAKLLHVVPAAPEVGYCLDLDDDDLDDVEPPFLLPDAARTAASAAISSTDPALVDAVCWLAAQVKTVMTEIEAAKQKCLGNAAADTASGTFAQWPVDAGILDWSNRWPGELDRETVLAIGQLAAGQQVKANDGSDHLPAIVGQPEVLLALAAAPLLPTEAIQGAAAAFGAALDAGLCTSTAAAFRFTLESKELLDRVVATATGPAVLLKPEHHGFGEVTRYGVSPGGAIPARVGSHPTELDCSANVDPARIVTAFEKLLADGPPPWNPQWVEEFSAGTGWSLAAAKVFLTALPKLHDWDNNYVPKDLRALLGLKVAEASAAREFLKNLGTRLLRELLSAGARDPLALVTSGPNIAAMVALWRERQVGKVLVPEEIQAEAAKIGPAGEVFAALGDSRFDDWPVRRYGLEILTWMASALRRDDPLRPWVAEQFTILREQAPAWQWETDLWDVEALLKLLGLSTDAPQAGPWRVTADTTSYSHATRYTITFDGSLVTDWRAQREQFEALADWDFSDLGGFLCLIDGDYDALIADCLLTGDGYGQDPLVSAPDVTAEVAETLGLESDAARYWLQLLALHNPTDKNISQWNGWTKRQREDATAPLLAAELVLNAKRARAGRSVFLPGGWQEATNPHLPMEVWKAPLYDLLDKPKVTPRGAAVMPRLPLGQLFADAWSRYREGDRPGYIELRTTRYRRR